MSSAIVLKKLLGLMPRYQVIWEGGKRVRMTNVARRSNVPVRALP